MKILVTGTAGFIGSNFSHSFKKRFSDVEIIGIDDFSSGRKDAVPENVTFYEGSVADRKFLDGVLSKHKPEYIFHFAAVPRVSYSVENPIETTEANIDGTVVLLTVAKDHGVKRVIFSSSSSVYGGADKLPTKESENFPNPKSPYAAQKYAGEVFCKIFSDLYGIDTVSLRYFNVFGPGQYGDSAYSTVVSAWLEALYFPSKKPFIEGDGSQSRDFCFVDNVVNANILAMQSERVFKGEEFNVAHGERTSLNELKEMIEEATGREISLEKRPPRVGDVDHTHADISKAKEWFGYEPTVNMNEGIKKTVEWFESRVQA